MVYLRIQETPFLVLTEGPPQCNPSLDAHCESHADYERRISVTKDLLVLILVVLALVVCSPLDGGADDSKTPPRVISTEPQSEAADVDPSVSTITVTFNKPMMDKSWSWSYESKESFPQMTGEPFYTENGRSCVLPVKLKPGTRYVIWINTSKFKNFKDKSGNPAEPYKIAFSTFRK
jgi:hypothetical protein